MPQNRGFCAGRLRGPGTLAACAAGKLAGAVESGDGLLLRSFAQLARSQLD